MFPSQRGPLQWHPQAQKGGEPFLSKGAGRQCGAGSAPHHFHAMHVYLRLGGEQFALDLPPDADVQALHAAARAAVGDGPPLGGEHFTEYGGWGV
eukprot:gene18753-biopygen21981